VLLEGVPGLAKTLTISTLARAIDATFRRIQFTPDLLPADLTGTLIYSPRDGTFSARKGPVFANFVLADEINRAPAKVQSALLEAMQERHVTIGEETYALPDPFLVLATQNPIEQAGTYRLPEAQLDRFIMKASIGYPDHASTLRILEGSRSRAHETELPSIISSSVVGKLAQSARTVHVDSSINDYVSRLVDGTRSAVEVRLGVSVRGALALIRTAKTLAAANGRHYVIPDDVKALAEPVLAHRLILDPEAEFDGVTASSVIGQLLIETAPPSDRQAV
jgi:MoxR-like ATPase